MKLTYQQEEVVDELAEGDALDERALVVQDALDEDELECDALEQDALVRGGALELYALVHDELEHDELVLDALEQDDAQARDDVLEHDELYALEDGNDALGNGELDGVLIFF